MTITGETPDLDVVVDTLSGESANELGTQELSAQGPEFADGNIQPTGIDALSQDEQNIALAAAALRESWDARDSEERRDALKVLSRLGGTSLEVYQMAQSMGVRR